MYAPVFIVNAMVGAAEPLTRHTDACMGENGVKIKIILPFCVFYKKRFIFVICNIASKRTLTNYLFII